MKSSFNAPDYLTRIGYTGSLPKVSIDTLNELHKRHLFTVPFENLDVHLNREISLDINRSFNKIAPGRRGGFCYEVNNLFHHLLKDLGFELYFISSMVYRPETDSYAPDFGHISNVVVIDGEKWLADVGFGDGYIWPLRFELGLLQQQRGVRYQLEEHGDGILLSKAADGQAFTGMYKFVHTPRNIEEFQGMCTFHQSSPESPFLRKKICTLPNDEGRITLTHDTLITTKNGVKESRPLSGEVEFEELLNQIFGINL